jgi:hypothetical protein
VIGALALAHVFGFMSPSTAAKVANEKSQKAVVAAMAPSCASDFRELPDASQRMAKLVANKDNYSAKDAFPDALITLPGRSYIDYDLVRACTVLLTAPTKSAATP